MATAVDLLGYAKTLLGVPYVYGGATPATGLDCSGFTQYVFGHFGISLPHHSEDQAKMGTSVAKNAIQAGDLVFSDWGDGPNSHVGIATGDGRIIAAPHTGATVRYDQLSSSYLAHVTAVRRFPLQAGATLTSAPGLAGGGGLLSLAIPAEVSAFFTDAQKAVSGTLWWFNPTHITRVLAGGAGLVAILLGVLFLSREVR